MCVYRRKQNVIQEAVDRLPSAGGTVIVPRGNWKSGAIHLKSNVKLYLEEGCVIHFSSCMEDYLPPVFTRWEGVECYNYSPLIYAADCENVTICGTGVLDGAGSAWVALEKAPAECGGSPDPGGKSGDCGRRARICDQGGMRSVPRSSSS